MPTHDYLEAELAAHGKFSLENSGSACFFWRLIELLGVIAILAGLLLPALSRAKAKGKQGQLLQQPQANGAPHG